MAYLYFAIFSKLLVINHNNARCKMLLERFVFSFLLNFGRWNHLQVLFNGVVRIVFCQIFDTHFSRVESRMYDFSLIILLLGLDYTKFMVKMVNYLFLKWWVRFWLSIECIIELRLINETVQQSMEPIHFIDLRSFKSQEWWKSKMILV